MMLRKQMAIGLLGSGLLLSAASFALCNPPTGTPGNAVTTTQPAQPHATMPRVFTGTTFRAPTTQPSNPDGIRKEQAALRDRAAAIRRDRAEAGEPTGRFSELAEAAKAIAAARRTQERDTAADPNVQAARKAVTAAEAAALAAVDAEVGATPAGKALLADVQKQRDAQNEQSFQVRLNAVILSEYTSHLFGNDADLQPWREKAEQAQRALYEMRRHEREHESPAAAARPQAELVKGANNHFVIQQTDRPTLGPGNTSHSELQADEAAIKAYNDKLAVKQAGNAITADLLRKGAAAAQVLKDTQSKLEDVAMKLAEARAKAPETDKIAAARKAAGAAIVALRQAIANANPADQTAVDAAQKAYDAKRTAATGGNPDATANAPHAQNQQGTQAVQAAQRAKKQ